MASINGSGKILYRGNPEHITRSIEGSGSIEAIPEYALNFNDWISFDQGGWHFLLVNFVLLGHNLLINFFAFEDCLA